MKQPYDELITWRCVTIRVRQVRTGGYRSKDGPQGVERPFVPYGTHHVPKLSRYELTHNGRYLWSDTSKERARKMARKFADRIADRAKGVTDGK